MRFSSFSAKKGVIGIADEGFLLGPDSKTLIDPENVFFYTYKYQEQSIYHLLIQEGNDIHLFDNTLFFEKSAIVELLLNHPKINKNSYEVSEVRIEEDSGYLKIEGDRELIWGYARGGAYEFIYVVPYRKSRIFQSVPREDMLRTNSWAMENMEIDDVELKRNPKFTPTFGIWENVPEFWRNHYKRKDVTEDRRWGCQKQFLILLAIVVLYVIYWQIFGKS